MTITNYKIDSSKVKILSHEKNNVKSFELTITDGKLTSVKIYYPDGQLLNETLIADGKVILYRIYKEKDKKNSKSNDVIPNLEYEINLNENKLLENYKLYDSITSKKIYEGEQINGKKSGYGTEYAKNGNIRYKGYFLNDQMHGQGSLYFDNGSSEFCGAFLRGKKNGFGMNYFSDGNQKFEGNWFNDMKNGDGKILYNNGNQKFQGNWHNDIMAGDGKMFYNNGNMDLDGNFNGDYFNGLYFNENGIKNYQGEMNYDSDLEFYMKHGFGDSYFENGTKEYSGQWENNEFDGHGTVYYKNGGVNYTGEFKDNEFHGMGAKYDYCERLMCMGKWNNGELESINLTDEHQLKGYQIKNMDDVIHVGEVSNGVKSVYGEQYQISNGLKICEGYYKNNKSSGLCKWYYEEQIDHQALQHFGYQSEGNWHGFSMNYHSNGKLKQRLFARNNAILIDKFRTEYQSNGQINFGNSFKGELYLMKDFKRDNM